MRKKELIAIILTLVVTLFTGLCISVVKAQESTQVNPFETTYDFNETVDVPSREIQVNGQSTPSVAVVTYPSGKTVSSSSVKLSEAGIYTVEYRALVNGKTYKESYSFTVAYPTYSLFSNSGTVSYQDVTVNDATVEGLYVKLGNGNTFTCNQAIDLTKMSEDENLISMYMVPEAVEELDGWNFYVQITDAVDESNYITLKINQSKDTHDAARACVYYAAKAHNQSDYWGVEAGGETGNPIPGTQWGYAAPASFYGRGFGDPTYEMRFYYDNATQTLYARQNMYAAGGNYIIDFNNPLCFEKGWDGFKSGKVRISVYGGGYIKSNMGCLITSIAQTDLSKETLEVSKPDNLAIDFGDYDETSYPNAVVGQPYRIFDATPACIYTAERLDVTVKTSYGSSNPLNVDIKNGYFIPQRAVTHTIVYTVTDAYGNVTEYPVPVTVDETCEPVTFALNEDAVSTSLGEWVELPKITSMEGGNGKLKLTVLLKNTANGKTEVITGDTYRFVEQGEFVLIYKLEDYNSVSMTKEVAVTLADSAKPIFVDELILPMTYIKGAKYEVPALTADDFSSGNLKKITASAKVYGDTTELPVTDGVFVANGTQVTLEYTATDANGNNNFKRYTIPVTDVDFINDDGSEGQINTAKYFQAVGGEVGYETIIVEKAERQVVVAKAIENTAEFTFIREMNGKELSVSCKMLADRSNYEKLIFRLTDYTDSNKFVNVILTNDGGKIAVSINGEKAVKTGFNFADGLSNLNIEITNTKLFVGNQNFAIKTYADGTTFNGFEGLAYFTFAMENCVGESALQINEICGQSLYVGARDLEPRLMFPDNRCVGEKEINSTIIIEPVKAIDVLDPYTEVTFSLVMPSGGYATALDGTILKNVKMNKIYQVKVTEYGRYRATYNSDASRGRDDNYLEVFTCYDEIQPSVSVGKTEITGKVGERLVIPEYFVSDNLSEETKLVKWIMIVTPDGIYQTYDENTGYIPTKRGTYIIWYYVLDENWNSAMTSVVCHVN